MIRSFRCKETRRIYEGHKSKRFAAYQQAIERKLQMLQSAVTLNDLRALPGTELEALDRDRKGQHSIRVNKQFRICFRWTPDGAEDIEFIDYH